MYVTYSDALYATLYLWGLGRERGMHRKYPASRTGEGGLLLRGEGVVVEF